MGFILCTFLKENQNTLTTWVLQKSVPNMVLVCMLSFSYVYIKQLVAVADSTHWSGIQTVFWQKYIILLLLLLFFFQFFSVWFLFLFWFFFSLVATPLSAAAVHVQLHMRNIISFASHSRSTVLLLASAALLYQQHFDKAHTLPSTWVQNLSFGTD